MALAGSAAAGFTAAELVGTRQAERRVLRLTNPNLAGAASNTLVANIQIVMPG
jgi:gentisate 1,2-dioxygenase